MTLRKTEHSSSLLGSDSGFGVGRYFSSCALSRWGRLFLLLSFASGYQSASAQSVVETFGTGSNQFTMEFVPIGNPNNPADTTGSPVPVGSVAYSYNLGKQEVSRDMISKANLAGNLGITMADMSSRGGNGVNWPATGITWNEAATYVNWLNTSTGGTPAYKFVGGIFTLWSPGDAGYNPNNQFRNSLAKYVIASNNEWYKGAYGNRDGTWNNYATGSDSAPTAVASGTAANTAVYSVQGPADITSAGGLSPYETMGQSGNVWEWNETGFDGMNNTADENREVRGGTWGSVSDSLGASVRFSYSPTFEYDDIGFRVAVVSSTISPSDFTSTINNGSVTITGYTGTGGNVVVPGTIGGLPVTQIGNFAFQSKSNLTAVTIPDGVTTIGSNAFADCANLASVTLPSSVTLIMSGAFYLCPELTTISIPSSVGEIQYNAFFNCYKLASVYFLRNTPPTIGSDAFKNIASGAVGYYPAGATGYASLSISGLTFEVTASPASDFTRTTDGTSVTITGYTGTGGNVVIPGTIEGLPVTQIGNAAFKEKTSITAITFPDSVTAIGYEAFYHCDNLTSITFGSGLKTIGDWAFAWCGKLPTLVIPNSVTSLGEGAVSDCSALTSLTIGNQVPVIWRFTFSGDSNLTAVTLPASVGSIGEQAFSHCTKLATINFQQSVPPYVNGDAFMDIASGAMGYYLESANMGWSGMSGAGSNSGNALSFNGNNQYLVAGAGTDHVLTTGTIECWIRSDVPVADTDGFHGIMVKQGSYGLFLKGNELIAYDWQNGGERHTFRFLRDERNNGWHHVAMSFQSGVTDGTVIYLDGQPVLTTTYTVGDSNDPLAIGAGFASSSQLFQGMMDEVRVWNIVRTPAQIANYRNVSVPSTSSGLVSYFKLDESSGSSAGNAVAGGATATVYESPSWNSLSISGLTFPQIKESQTIIYNGLGNLTKAVGDLDFTLAATKGASSSPLMFSSSNPSVATITVAGLVSIVGQGLTTLSITQAGDATYNAAPTVNVFLDVSGLTGGTGGGTGGVVTPIGGGTGGGLSQVPAPVLNLPATLTYGQKMILPGAAQSLQVSKSVNQTIPSGTPTGMSSSATVSGLTGSNYSFTLGVKIIPVENGGGFLGDLKAYLRHEQLDENGGTLVNQTRMLIDRIGVTQADPDGSLAEGLNVIFGDSFSNNIQDASAPGGSLLSGNFAPASSFAGTDPARAGPFSGLAGTSNLWNGTYTLVVADMSTGAEMKLDSWSMQFHSLAASVGGGGLGVGDTTLISTSGAFSPEGGLTYEIVENGLGTQESGLGKIDGNQLEAKSGTGTITIRAKYAATLASTASEWTTKTITLSKASQSITFNAPDSVSLFSEYVNLGATTDSGVTVTYTSQNTIVATIDAYYLRPQAAGDVEIWADAAGNANYENAITVIKTIHVLATPIRPLLGLSKLFSQDSTNGPVTGVVQGTNTYTYEGIQSAEASALAGIASVKVESPTNSYFASLGRTNEIAPGVIGYSGFSNPPSYTSYEAATNQYSDGSYNFIGQNTNYMPMTNTTVTLAWSNSTNAFPSQAPAIQGGPWAANSLKMVAGTNNTLAWAAWSNRPTQGTNTIRLEIKTYSPYGFEGQTIITTNLPAYSTNCAITGLTNTNSFYQATLGFVSDDGGATRSTSTKFRIVTGPMNPPANPILLGDLIGNMNVAPGTDVVGTLAEFSDPDEGDTETLSLPALTWPDSNDNNLFVLDGRTIKLAAGSFDYATQSFYSILVRATDSYGLYSDTPYTIVVRQDVSNEISLTGPQDSEYDGYPKSFLASVAGGGEFAIEYQGRGGTFYAASAIAPTNTGDYTVTATATDLDKIGSKSQEFTIRKATPTILSPPTSTPIIFGQTLASSTLNGGSASALGTFAFTMTSTAPNAGTDSQNVTFIPSDTANYNTTTTIVSVKVNKATPAILSPPTSATILYGQTLSSSGLSGGEASVQGTFGWMTPSTVPTAGTSSQSFVFTPSDSANYNTATASVSVTVALDPSGDEDGDGATNEAELAAETDPYDSASGPYQPVAFGDAFTAKLAAGMTTKVTTASLISNDKYSGIPGETRGVTFVSAAGTSTGGASIRVKGGWLIYQPSPSAQNGTTDTFTYTVSNGLKTATGTVTVSLVAPDYVAEVAIDRVSGNQVYFSVMPGMTFEVQGTSQLGTSPEWAVLPNGPNPYWTSGADGRLIVTDPAAVGAGSRFYRFRWIP